MLSIFDVMLILSLLRGKMEHELMCHFVANCTSTNFIPACSSCIGIILPQNYPLYLKCFIILEAGCCLRLLCSWDCTSNTVKGIRLHTYGFSTYELRIWRVISIFLTYVAFFVCRNYVALVFQGKAVVLFCFFLLIELFKASKLTLVSFFSQAGLTGPLQKEELQLGVDAANRAAQQYQQSKDQQKLLQQSDHGCGQKDESKTFGSVWRYVRSLSNC